mgnify:CR=1 FL=1
MAIKTQTATLAKTIPPTPIFFSFLMSRKDTYNPHK